MIFKVVFLVATALAVANASGLLLGSSYGGPKPYAFGYSVKDGGGEQHRQEVGDGVNGVKGNYGYVDSKGLKRQVDYVADNGGFRAVVKTNEPGTASQDPAGVKVLSTAHPYYGAGFGYGGLGAAGLGYGGFGAAGLGYGYDPAYAGYGLDGYKGLGYNNLAYGGYGALGYYGGANMAGLGYYGVGLY